MFRRRPLMRAAVVGGGAYMAGKHVARSQEAKAQQEAEQDQRLSDLEAQQQQDPSQQQPPPPAPAAPPAAAPAGSSAMIDQLNQLAALHQQGVLTDDEFAAAKAKLFAT